MLGPPYSNLSDDGENFTQTQAQNQPKSSKSDQKIKHEVNYKVCFQSQKIKQVCEMLREGSPLVNHQEKIVIFSTWTRFLDL